METTLRNTACTVRRAEPGDYEAITRLFSGPKVVRGTLQLPFPFAEAWRKRLAEPADGYYGLVACVLGELVGELGLITFPNAPRRRHAARLGMAVRDDWQGKGIGSALMQAAVDLADKWLNITRLELEVFTDNEPAVRLYKKFGFVIEGTAVQFAFRDGQFVDVYTMARLRNSV
ncbi:MAG TPA: GNAT family N-acetyltransferase [Anaerolineales bacterium]|nr:GNAT family N-acetyltransferase [Anaerolineales bacterium]